MVGLGTLSVDGGNVSGEEMPQSYRERVWQMLVVEWHKANWDSWPHSLNAVLPSKKSRDDVQPGLSLGLHSQD